MGVACPKNHIQHTTNTATNMEEAKIHLHHHKNSGRHGAVEYEVAPDMVKVWAMMEAAAAVLGRHARGFFFSSINYKRKSRDQYGEDYFSNIISKQLSKCGKWVCANQVRHLFSTMFSAYLGQATFHQADLSIAYLRDAAAVMTGSSSNTWNTTYDANARVQGYRRVLHHYSAFKEWVKADFARQQATLPRNPITGQVHG